MNETTKRNLGRNLLAVLITIIWVVTLYQKYKTGLDLPVSVEIGVTVVLSYIFGTTAVQTIIDYWRRK